MVCVLQNGVEQRQQFAPLTGGATVLPSVVWFPAQRDADASVWLRAAPRLTRLGEQPVHAATAYVYDWLVALYSRAIENIDYQHPHDVQPDARRALRALIM